MKRAWAILVVACLLGFGTALFAQIRGVPPSVTSLSPNHSFPPGVAPSITSVGPNGFGNFPCCFNGWGFAFGQRTFVRPRFDNFHRHRHFGSFIVPLYIPYYPYVPLVYPDMMSSEDADSAAPAIGDYRSRVTPAADQRYGEHSFVESRDEQPAADGIEQVKVAPSEVAQDQEPTVLVFRDGHRMEVRNYAIVGQVLYNFDAKGKHKIPLSDLDLDSTRKINDDRGIEFRLPGQ